MTRAFKWMVVWCFLAGLPVQAQVVRSVTSLAVDKPAALADVPQALHVYLDRVVYTENDRDGQGLVVINPPAWLLSGKLQGHTVRVQLRGPDGSAVDQPVEAAVGDSDHFALDLDIPKAAVGTHQVTATLLDASGQAVSSGAASFTKIRVPAPALQLPQEIPLVLTHDPQLVNFQNVPISTGIPLPDGLLEDAGQVSLWENGREIPCQTTVRARWTRRGTIKWLGLDFQARYINGQPAQYTLRLGTPSTVAAAKPVTLHQTPQSFVLSNGVLELVIGRQSFRMFDQVKLDRNADGQFGPDEAIIEGKPLDGPYWVNAEGKSFFAALDQQPQVRVEESGSLRTTLRVDGWLVAADGAQAGRYTTRITLQAGKAQVAVNQTYFITWNTIDQAMRIRDMGVAVSPVELTQAHQLSGPFTALPDDGDLYMLCDRWDRKTIAQSPGNKVISTEASESLRYNVTNWLNSRMPLTYGGVGPRGFVTVAQRYMAEKFPKQISVARNQLTWHAWPRNGSSQLQAGTALENLGKLYWLHQGELLDFQIPQDYFNAIEQYRQLNPGVRVTLLMYPEHDYYASGTAISGELLYAFAAHTSPESGPLWSAATPLVNAFNHHPQAIADPQWSAQTGLLEFAPPFVPEYGEIERGVSELFDRTYATIDEQEFYGQFLWPNGTTYLGESFTALHRNRLNAHHGSELLGWALYLRSGQMKYWHYATAMSRYLIDHASANYDPYNPATDPTPAWGVWPGSTYHCQGFVPWSKREPELLGHTSPQWHACLLYYMTGDTQAMDLARHAATSVLKSVRTAANYRVREPYNGVLNRNPACGWAMITNLYAELLDPRLLRPIGDIGAQIFNGQPLNLDGGAPPEGQSGRWWWHTYTQQWRDPAAIETIASQSPTGGLSFAGYNTYCTDITGDSTPVYALWFETQGLAPLRQWGLGHPQKLSSVSFTADNINFLLPMVTAMKRLNLPEVPQLVPAGFDPASYVVFQEESDTSFTIRFWGPVYEGPEDPVKHKPVSYIVTDPQGKSVASGQIDRKKLGIRPDLASHIQIEADGVAGEYTLRFTDGGPIALAAPTSNLAKEVYVVPAGRLLSATHLYWRTAPGELQRTLHPISMRVGENYSLLLRLEHTDGSMVTQVESPAAIQLNVQPQTMYRLSMTIAGQTGYAWRWKGFLTPSRQLTAGPDMILAADESRWFQPAAGPPR